MIIFSKNKRDRFKKNKKFYSSLFNLPTIENMSLSADNLKVFFSKKDSKYVLHGSTFQLLCSEKNGEPMTVKYAPQVNQFNPESKNMKMTLETSLSQINNLLEFEELLMIKLKEVNCDAEFFSNINGIDNTIGVKITDKTVVKGVAPNGLVDMKWEDIKYGAIVTASVKLSGFWLMEIGQDKIPHVGYSILVEELVVSAGKIKPVEPKRNFSIFDSFDKKSSTKEPVKKRTKAMPFEEHKKLSGDE